MKKEYIKLPDIRGQKIRKKYYIASAVKHPAKADLPMMIWILKKFVEDGDVVLDPLAGIGGTLVEGMRLFPNSLFVGVELEEKFVKWCNASIKKVEEIAKEDWFMKVGKAICLQGDSRELGKIMGVDKIVSSPPWGGQVQHKTNYLGKQKKESGFEYSEDPKNIGNLPHGKVDKVITSPPYSETIRKGQEGSSVTAQSKRFAKLMEERDKLLNRNWGKNRQTEGRLRAIEAMLSGYSRNPENIGNLKHGDVDKIITSPPFGQAQSGGGIAKKGYTGSKHSPTDLVGKRSYMPENTGEDKKNISNLPYADKDEKLDKQTYLQAMFLVYQQCFKILKSEGLMILIIKDFIRKGKRIPLGEHTIKLCEMAGFEHVHTYHREIKNPSFWRILQIQKYGEAYRIDCEDIIILKKIKEDKNVPRQIFRNF